MQIGRLYYVHYEQVDADSVIDPFDCDRRHSTYVLTEILYIVLAFERIESTKIFRILGVVVRRIWVTFCSGR